MARKPNYSGEKRRKELERQARKNEKLQRKREQASEQSEERKLPALEDESATAPE